MGTTPVPPGKDFYIKQGLYRGGTVGGRADVLWIGPTSAVRVSRRLSGRPSTPRTAANSVAH